ncbi:hypothetical protein NDU88_000828 [Pleurodeles waltl]|uniref:Secreted protein n=1 Tax=Pleurodeles waltl TaxID=8319 RepID=A0AAV7LXZ2_PLEWA|nr:hypothetical protein NDU88_000828 [Pleurodeles waltl]
MLVFRDWALMFVRSLKLPVRLDAYGMQGCIRGCVLRNGQRTAFVSKLRTSPSTWPLLSTQSFGVIKQQFPETLVCGLFSRPQLDLHRAVSLCVCFVTRP